MHHPSPVIKHPSLFTCDTGPLWALISTPEQPPAAHNQRAPSMPPDRMRPSGNQVTLVTHLWVMFWIGGGGGVTAKGEMIGTVRKVAAQAGQDDAFILGAMPTLSPHPATRADGCCLLLHPTKQPHPTTMGGVCRIILLYTHFPPASNCFECAAAPPSTLCLCALQPAYVVPQKGTHSLCPHVLENRVRRLWHVSASTT